MSRSELNKCPKCGYEGNMRNQWFIGKEYEVICTNRACLCRTGWTNSYKEALSAWSRGEVIS